MMIIRSPSLTHHASKLQYTTEQFIEQSNSNPILLFQPKILRKFNSAPGCIPSTKKKLKCQKMFEKKFYMYISVIVC
jgi:hypothetical protein